MLYGGTIEGVDEMVKFGGAGATALASAASLMVEALAHQTPATHILTERDGDVLQLVARGLCNQDLGDS